MGQTLIAVSPEELRALIADGVRDALEKRPGASKRYVDADELAEQYGVSRSTVHNWVKRDGCPCERRGKILRFDVAAVEAWFRGREPGLRRVK